MKDPKKNFRQLVPMVEQHITFLNNASISGSTVRVIESPIDGDKYKGIEFITIMPHPMNLSDANGPIDTHIYLAGESDE
mgnify:CR=1 FL=1